MNGLTSSELAQLKRIRALATRFYESHDLTDLAIAKRAATRWCLASKTRRPYRERACRTVKHLYAHIGDRDE